MFLLIGRHLPKRPICYILRHIKTWTFASVGVNVDKTKRLPLSPLDLESYSTGRRKEFWGIGAMCVEYEKFKCIYVKNIMLATIDKLLSIIKLLLRYMN